jgi:hypothetical protein
MPNHILGDGNLGEMNVELEQLPVNPRSAPQRVGLTHRSNEISEGWINTGMAELLHAAFPTPVQSKPLPMPSKDGLRLHDDKSLGPVTPNS